ncbi:MAG: TldD/PmbA family protein, partial [Rhodobacteraceae bacterium]|nr:TldD/PmbA family protein [Paracoccaceae bacterium]
MPADLAALTDQLLTAARRAGADAADALAVDGTSIAIDVVKGSLEHAERAEGIDIGLRVLIGTRQAVVSSSDTKPDTILEMAARAVAMAREAPEDPTVGLADPGDLARDWNAAALDLLDAAPEPAPAYLQDAAARAEAAALAVSGITKMDASSAAYGRRSLHLAATNGFSGG